MKWIALIGLFFLFAGLTPAANKTNVRVLIDAGHGGSDPGHLSHHTTYKSEKEINLLIANYLGGYIEKYLGNVEVYYTRKDDRFLSLDQRVTKANDNNIDYFLSIHCNGNPKQNVFGTESHVHNFDAKKSYNLARDIEKQFSSRAGRHSRGIKNNQDRSHSIQVLKFTKMTSVLVECGFLTNEKEASYLNSNNGQEIIASAVFRAFRSSVQRDYPTISFAPKGAKGAYSIQIMSSIDPIEKSHNSFKRLDFEVSRIKMNTTNAYKYKYLVGSFSSKKEATNTLAKIRKSGFPDALVVRN